MSQQTRVALGALVVIVAIAAFAISRPSGSSKSTKSASVVHLQIRGGKPVGGVRTIMVKKGSRVRFTVTSDVADEIHVHGYDYHKQIPAGGTVRLDFAGSIDGIFIVELEHRGEQIASLQVQP